MALGHTPVMDRCRVRWGKVVAVNALAEVIVESRPLNWDGRLLTLGEPMAETARLPLRQRGVCPRAGPW